MIKTLTAAAAAITLSTLASAQDPQGFIPPGQEGFAESFRVSPAIRAGNFVFISGVVGAIPLDRERTPEAYEAAIRSAFEDVETTLNASGTGWEDVVEMTTFHVDLRDHQTIFRRVREEFIVSEPYPAWTGIGVESLWGRHYLLRSVSKPISEATNRPGLPPRAPTLRRSARIESSAQQQPYAWHQAPLAFLVTFSHPVPQSP